jgi:hypothetical protein
MDAVMICEQIAAHLPYATFPDRRLLDPSDPRTVQSAEAETPSSIMFVFPGRDRPLWHSGDLKQVNSHNVGSLKRQGIIPTVELYEALISIGLVVCAAFTRKRIVLVVRSVVPEELEKVAMMATEAVEAYRRKLRERIVNGPVCLAF